MKALVLAGGFDQIALIEELRIRGYYVILADYYENPIAKSAADKHCQISTLDVQQVESLAIAEKVDIITTACTDQALLTVAQVSEKLNLPCYLDYATARNVTNKEFMKKTFIENGVPTAKHIIVDSVKDVERKIKQLKYPLIVKPVDCNSSKGVVKVFDVESLMVAINNAISFSRTATAVVEEFIQGREYTVDFWIEDGVPRLLMASEILKFKNRSTFTINGCKTLPDLPDGKLRQLANIAEQIAKAFKLYNMPMFMQVIDDGKDIYVLEFSARMGGGTKYKMIELYSGFPIMKKYVDRVLGQSVSITNTLTKTHMLLSFIYCTKGVFKSLDGIDELIRNKTIDEVYQYKEVGTMFDKAENSGDRVAGMLITGQNDEQLFEKEKRLYNNLKVINDAGENMLLKID